MDPALNLKQDLSMLLDQELTKQLMIGENVIISLPGSFGEALVVTDKRALVLRDRDSGPGCDIHAYLLSSVSGAEAAASGTGGYIELKVPEAASTPDDARVYFASYDLAKFQQAAESISGLVSAPAAGAAAAAPSEVVAAQPVSTATCAAKCGRCGASVEFDSVYCAQCGVQLRPRCANCGSSSSPGSAFCESCGGRFEEWPSECAKCGNRVQRWQTYCTECGSILQQSCASCGAIVFPNWKYCAHCGREFGTAYLNPRTNVARRIQERVSQLEQSQQQPEAVVGSAPAVQPPSTFTAASTPTAPQAAPSSPAEQHNQKGRELFDAGNVEGAIEEFQAAISVDPNNASYHCNLAIAYDEDQQDDEAKAEYEEALRLDPNDLQTLLCLGYMYNENDDTEMANEVWGKILQLAPDSAEAQEVKDNLSHQQEL